MVNSLSEIKKSIDTSRLYLLCFLLLTAEQRTAPCAEWAGACMHVKFTWTEARDLGIHHPCMISRCRIPRATVQMPPRVHFNSLCVPDMYVL
jgi:hypothetical protein